MSKKDEISTYEELFSRMSNFFKKRGQEFDVKNFVVDINQLLMCEDETVEAHSHDVELKNCPICKSEAQLLDEYSHCDFFVACKKCHLRTKGFDKCDYCEAEEIVCPNCPPEAIEGAQNAAIEAWNTRYQEANS